MVACALQRKYKTLYTTRATKALSQRSNHEPQLELCFATAEKGPLLADIHPSKFHASVCNQLISLLDLLGANIRPQP